MRSDQESFIPPPSGESVPFQEIVQTLLNVSSSETKATEPAAFKLTIDAKRLERAAEQVARSSEHVSSKPRESEAKR